MMKPKRGPPDEDRLAGLERRGSAKRRATEQHPVLAAVIGDDDPLVAPLDLEMDPAFAGRYLNDGFSGGEKKRLEILQLLMLKPRFALLDETDSGLDIDALKVVAEGIKAAASQDVGMVLVTHYQRLLNYVRPHVVHVFMDGRIVRTGGPELALELEERGYDWLETPATAGGA